MCALQEFRAFVELCDGLGIHFNMYFSEGGQPTLFAAETDQGEALQVEMVVATVLHDEPTASQVRRTARDDSSFAQSPPEFVRGVVQMSQSSMGTMSTSGSTQPTQSRPMASRSDAGYRSDTCDTLPSLPQSSAIVTGGFCAS